MIKYAGVSLGAMLVFALITGLTIDDEKSVAKSTNKTEKAEVSAPVVEKEKETEEEKAVRVVKETEAKIKAEEEKLKAEADKKAKAEAEKVKIAEEKRVAEVKFYQEDLAPQMESLMKEYDAIWDQLWVATFNGVSNGSVDVYIAYSNMISLDSEYKALSSKIQVVEKGSLSKENQKELKTFKSKLNSAVTYRRMAADTAADMFDAGTFKPSEFEEVKGIINASDGDMMQAVLSRAIIEENLGILPE